VIRDAVSAANHSLLTGHSKEMRFPGETNSGTEVLVLIWNLRHSRHGCRGRSTPEWRGAALVRHCYIVQQVDRLAGKLPAQPQIDSQVVLDPPVVSRVSSDVVLLEVEFRRTIRQAEQRD